MRCAGIVCSSHRSFHEPSASEEAQTEAEPPSASPTGASRSAAESATATASPAVSPPPESRPAAATAAKAKEAEEAEAEGGVQVDQEVDRVDAAQSRMSMRLELQRISHEQATVGLRRLPLSGVSRASGWMIGAFSRCYRLAGRRGLRATVFSWTATPRQRVGCACKRVMVETAAHFTEGGWENREAADRDDVCMRTQGRAAKQLAGAAASLSKASVSKVSAAVEVGVACWAGTLAVRETLMARLRDSVSPLWVCDCQSNVRRRLRRHLIDGPDPLDPGA